MKTVGKKNKTWEIQKTVKTVGKNNMGDKRTKNDKSGRGQLEKMKNKSKMVCGKKAGCEKNHEVYRGN